MTDAHQATATPRRVGVREFRGNLTGFLQEVSRGSTLLITSRDKVLAELRPPSSEARTPRTPGVLRGKIRIAPDFDELPPDILAAMEGREE